MGALLPRYRKAIVEDIITSISTNNAFYYAFASNPARINGPTPTFTNDEYSTIFKSDWTMLFGKKISNNDIRAVVKDIPWVSNTVYDRYDNRDPNLYSKNFYVVTEPQTTGGWYNYYVCIDNANSNPSLVQPDIAQGTSFIKSDGYIWRYVASVSSEDYIKFKNNTYAPIVSNTTLKASAALNSGVDIVVVSNSGSDYRAYANGVVQSNPTSNSIQIESVRSNISGFYINCGIYIYTTGYNTAEMKTITDYVVNSSGNWVFFDTEANTNNITPGITEYMISPRVIFQTDGSEQPKGYAVVNASSNTIDKVVITDTGTNISRANVYILPGNYGSGANLYAITPPPGGYGYDPISELNVKGVSIAFDFANTEGGLIPTNISYNKIGIIKNPSVMNPNGVKGTLPWANSTFSQVLKANVSPSMTYSVGDIVVGANSGAMGMVAFSNSSTLHLVGDKFFSNGEFVSNTSGSTTRLDINKDVSSKYIIGDIYAKDLEPLYVQQLNDVQRSNSQTESYKLIIQV